MRYRVLVVDDFEDTAVSLAHLVNSMGHEAEFTTDPFKAYDLARTFTPHFMFVDIGMPRITGWELARQISSDDRLREVRLVAVSGYMRPADRARSYEAGFEVHVGKPLPIERLQEILDSERGGMPRED